jgi:CDP-paratose synthetase
LRHIDTIVLTGASGFLGSRLVARFDALGYKVITVAHQEKSPQSKTKDGSHPIKRLHYQGCPRTLMDDLGDLSKALWIHCAAAYNPTNSIDLVEQTVAANMSFGVAVLEACARSGLKSLINTSTVWEHNESGDISAVNDYAALKTAFQSYIDYATDAYSLHAFTLKLSDTYSEDDPRKKLLGLMKKSISGGQAVKMTHGYQSICLCHIDDVVNAFCVAANLLDSLRDNEGGVHRRYFVTGADVISIRKLAETIAVISGTTPNIEWGAHQPLTRLPSIPWTKGERLPGWSPTITLDEGLNRVFK